MGWERLRCAEPLRTLTYYPEGQVFFEGCFPSWDVERVETRRRAPFISFFTFVPTLPAVQGPSRSLTLKEHRSSYGSTSHRYTSIVTPRLLLFYPPFWLFVLTRDDRANQSLLESQPPSANERLLLLFSFFLFALLFFSFSPFLRATRFNATRFLFLFPSSSSPLLLFVFSLFFFFFLHLKLSHVACRIWFYEDTNLGSSSRSMRVFVWLNGRVEFVF